MYLCINR